MDWESAVARTISRVATHGSYYSVGGVGSFFISDDTASLFCQVGQWDFHPFSSVTILYDRSEDYFVVCACVRRRVRDRSDTEKGNLSRGGQHVVRPRVERKIKFPGNEGKEMGAHISFNWKNVWRHGERLPAWSMTRPFLCSNRWRPISGSLATCSSCVSSPSRSPPRTGNVGWFWFQASAFFVRTPLATRNITDCAQDSPFWIGGYAVRTIRVLAQQWLSTDKRRKKFGQSPCHTFNKVFCRILSVVKFPDRWYEGLFLRFGNYS